MCGSNNLVMVGMFEVLWKTTSSLMVVVRLIQRRYILHLKMTFSRRHIQLQKITSVLLNTIYCRKTI